ncbi:MAG: LON peptidase substrate-binding domain-containing protein [Candidatus Symbiobacter sp.]|nr:LON peptidase substrate-binding domain-containing protein [Candidatus Symbiobacter sp.]
MTGHATLQFHDLPSVIPIFPLKGTLLLPGGILNLTIFEPRYLEMLLDCLGTRQRLIGMVQPRPTTPPQDGAAASDGEADTEEEESDEADSPLGIVPIYQVGCAGRVSSFIETEEGRYVIALSGIARFAIARELPMSRAYRQIHPNWGEFAHDFEPAPDHLWSRHDFLERIKAYFKSEGIDANWKAIEQSPDWRLLTSLAMNCPFNSSEKQAILEAKTWRERATLFDALIAMAVFDGKNGQGDHGKRH